MTDDSTSHQPAQPHSVRRAMVLSSLSRYSVTIVGLLATFVVARLLSPVDFGLSLLGAAIFPVAEAVRDLGCISYIVQVKDLTRDKVRTAFTLSLVVTLAIAALIFVLAGPLAAFFGAPLLKLFIEVHLIAYLAGAPTRPLYALMSRKFSFGRIAVVEQVAALVYAAGSVLLVYAGWGIMGLAWATALAAGTSMLLCLIMEPAFWVYRPSLRHRREILSFGLHGSAAGLIGRLGDALNYFLLGTLLGPHATGILQRAALIAFWPERIALAGLGTVALPAFSNMMRQGQPLGPKYLRATSIASAVNWSALVSVALLAGPLVEVLLGPSWSQAVPPTLILAAAAFFTFSNSLNAAVQTAAGGIARTPLVTSIQYGLMLAAVLVGAYFGMLGVAWCGLIIAPFTALSSTLFVRRLVFFTWEDYWRAVLPSAFIAACTGLFVAPVVAVSGTSSPVLVCFAGGLASGIGFLVGTMLITHPLREEMQHVVQAITHGIQARSKGA